jgi:hypothetical protein
MSVDFSLFIFQLIKIFFFWLKKFYSSFVRLPLNLFGKDQKTEKSLSQQQV